MSDGGCGMTLNKKQKKQLDITRKKLSHAQQQLAGSRKQMDDPEEVRRLEREVATLLAEIAKIQES